MSENLLKDKTNLSLMRKQRRREKSRDAARCRRHKESDTFEEICNEIPIPKDVVTHLDKTALIRLLISYTKLRHALKIQSESSACEVKEEASCNIPLSDEDHVNALNSFLFLLSSDLDVLFVTGNVKDYLGLSQFDLIGQNIMTYTHEGDYEDLKACFEKENSRSSFFIRMKTTLTANGKSINLKSASYKRLSWKEIKKLVETNPNGSVLQVLRCTGFVQSGLNDSSYMVAHVEPIPHPSNIEHLLDCGTFLSQHTPDMKFIYCDDKFLNILNYDGSDVDDRSFFGFCHAADVKSLSNSFQKLYRLNQIETDQYRFLAKTGGYLWILTQATVITNQKTRKPQYIVCVHYVISGLEHKTMPLSIEQLENSGSACVSSSLAPSCGPAVVDEASSENENVSVQPDQISDFSEFDDLDCFDDDECCVAPMNFTTLDDSDGFPSKNLCFNAPSIGDPWSLSDDVSVQNDIDDLFLDVSVDNQDQCIKPITSSSNDVSQESNDFTLGFSPPHQWRESSPIYCGSSFGSRTPPSGSESPFGSVYSGSPHRIQESDFVCIDPNMVVKDVKKPPDVLPESHFPPFASYQSVKIPKNEYLHHAKNLKRGFVEDELDGNRVYLKSHHRKEEFGDVAKKRRTNKGSLPETRLPPLQKGIKSSKWNNARSMLLQPGQSYGYNSTADVSAATDMFASFLLQPELKVTRKTGREMIRNTSTGFLPELSLQDCEVNAPLEEGQDCHLLASDCVHLLDCQN